MLYDKLSDFFGKNSVMKTASVAGRDATWDAHNVVMISGYRSIFEYVSHNTNSIANKFYMFSDIHKAIDHSSLNSVVDSLESLGEKGLMLSDVSTLVPIEASKESFLSYAMAA